MLKKDESWRLPEHPEIHALGCDSKSLKACTNGLLTLGQAMTLGLGLPLANSGEPLWQAALRHEKEFLEKPCYIIVPKMGVVVASDLTSDRSVISWFRANDITATTINDLMSFTIEDIESYLIWQKDRWIEEKHTHNFSKVSTQI